MAEKWKRLCLAPGPLFVALGVLSIGLLESIVEMGQASDFNQARRIFYALLLAWSFVMTVCVTALRRRRLRRTVD